MDVEVTQGVQSRWWQSVGGVLALVYGGFTYTKETQDLKIGPLEMSIKGGRQHSHQGWRRGDRGWRVALGLRQQETVARGSDLPIHAGRSFAEHVTPAISKAHGEPITRRDPRVSGAGSHGEHARDATVTDSTAW